MSNWKKFYYNTWFSVNGRNDSEAKNFADKKIKYELGSTENIEEIEEMGGAWKKYDFKGWFTISARSPEEALKRAKAKIEEEEAILIPEDEVDLQYYKKKGGGINQDFLTDKDLGHSVAFHFSMSNKDHSSIHECHAASAREAWEALRSKYLYGEVVMLSQTVLIPVAFSNEWKTKDAMMKEKTPKRLSHQIVVAVGSAHEKWWAEYDNVVKVDEDANLLATPDLPTLLDI